jgi:hypothetical protein
MVMNIAATKTTPTATFWLIRGATASSPRGSVWPAAHHSRSYKISHPAEIPPGDRPESPAPAPHGTHGTLYQHRDSRP